MKNLVLDSISGRTLMVLVVGLTLSHLASTAILSYDRHGALAFAGEIMPAERLAVFSRLLDQALPDEREHLARSLSSPLLSVAIGPEPRIRGSHRDDIEHISIRQALKTYFGDIGRDRLHIASGSDDHGKTKSFWRRLASGFLDDQSLFVVLALNDGTWATFGMAASRPFAMWWSPRSLLSAIVMIAAILVLGRWAAGWIAAPIAAFARAADRLGRDVLAPPLPEQGPSEVRQAVSAFNEMQGRLRRFVEDRTRMLAAISHDLLSPITRMRLRAEMFPASGAREHTLADLDEMEAMVASTLDFARGEAMDELSETIDLAAMLETVCDNATDMGLPARFEWSGRIVYTGRPLAIKRALANLIENAARYGERAAVRARHAGPDIIITIEDKGPGIPEAEMEKVFTPFYRLECSRNRKSGGIGLGLTVARTIIWAHGGDVRLENRAHGGLRATVAIPRELAP